MLRAFRHAAVPDLGRHTAGGGTPHLPALFIPC